MTAPQRFPYNVGETVYVEATVVALEPGEPFGAVHVRIPEATDPSHLLDGVEAIAPQVVVHAGPGVECAEDYTAHALHGYVTHEGFYPEENE